jgi:hypothetical protein
MSNKTIMGLTLAAVTVAFAVVPMASFAKKVDCYGAKSAKDGAVMKMTEKKCKKEGGSTTKPATGMEEPAKTDAPAPAETPAS